LIVFVGAGVVVWCLVVWCLQWGWRVLLVGVGSCSVCIGGKKKKKTGIQMMDLVIAFLL